MERTEASSAIASLRKLLGEEGEILGDGSEPLTGSGLDVLSEVRSEINALAESLTRLSVEETSAMIAMLKQHFRHERECLGFHPTPPLVEVVNDLVRLARSNCPCLLIGPPDLPMAIIGSYVARRAFGHEPEVLGGSTLDDLKRLQGTSTERAETHRHRKNGVFVQNFDLIDWATQRAICDWTRRNGVPFLAVMDAPPADSSSSWQGYALRLEIGVGDRVHKLGCSSVWCEQERRGGPTDAEIGSWTVAKRTWREGLLPLDTLVAGLRPPGMGA